MQHEDFRLQYNEIMFDERDAIRSFLDRQADLRYGNQMYEYTLEPMPVLVAATGSKVRVREIRADKNDFVVFDVLPMNSTLKSTWRCYDFALGELSKILDGLPDIDEMVSKDSLDDIDRIHQDYNIKGLLKDVPYKFKLGEDIYYLYDVQFPNGEPKFLVEKEISSNSYIVVKDLRTLNLVDISNHIKAAVLKCSNEYRLLKQHLNCFGGNLYNFCESGDVGSVVITPAGTDLHLAVLDVSMEKGYLEVLVSVADTRIAEQTGEDTLLLHEHELTKENLDAINDFFKPNDIMDCYNGHNKVLVELINKAWHDMAKHERFAPVLYELYKRDIESYKERDIEIQEEHVEEYAHYIMENVCDDDDLKYILRSVGEDTIIKEMIELTGHQKEVVKKFKEVCQELNKENVGIVRNETTGEFLFLNMQQVSEIAVDKYLPDDARYYPVTDYLQEPMPDILETYFYSSDSEQVKVKFV